MMRATMATISKKKKSDKEDGEYDEWELDDAVRTLQRAEEIRQDKDLMAALEPRLDKSIKSLEGLRKLAAKRTSEEE